MSQIFEININSIGVEEKKKHQWMDTMLFLTLTNVTNGMFS